jgi:hypothetical protein
VYTSPILILKLILRRLCVGLLEKLSFRLRYLVGFVLFALILWVLKLTIVWLIDVKYLDSLKSNQFKSFEEQSQLIETNPAK